MLPNLTLLLILVTTILSCTKTNYLQSIAASQVDIDKVGLVNLQYKEKLHMLGHNFEPWQTNRYEGTGEVWFGKFAFMKSDTLINNRGRSYMSKTSYDGKTLLYLDYGDESLLPMTIDLFNEKVINTARYTPTIISRYFIEHSHESHQKVEEGRAEYSMKIGKYRVELLVNTNSQLVESISYLNYDELYGDVTTTYEYKAYKKVGSIDYPSMITVKKFNGNVVDNIEISSGKISDESAILLEKPDDYQLVLPEEDEEPRLKISSYNDYIHFIDLEHTDDKVMVVEFDEYVLVAEAPLNAKNGELIIKAARKIAPQKPIKYFAFGHHHPHYLGGLRAFVHKGTTILCTDVSKDYAAYIANAPHSLQPDSLEIEPTEAKLQVILDSLKIGADQEMIIYSIGDKSAHTKDYLLYYFPKEKLLFQDDLCWIPTDGPITKAGARQVGLYNSIMTLGLQVDTIIQSWPVTSHKVKTTFPFSDLEKSIQL